MAGRSGPPPNDAEISHGVPLFLSQLGDALRVATLGDAIDHTQLKKAAGLNGEELLDLGLSVAQVVHTYGDVCQVISQLAVDQRVPIPPSEFKTLNLCLDDAIAEAVTAHARRREHGITHQGTERLGILAHELRNALGSAMLSYDLVKSGTVTLGGTTGQMVGRSLLRLRDLIDRSLAEVRLDVGIERKEEIEVSDFIAELEIGARLEAKSRNLHLVVGTLERGVTIEGDRSILIAAVSNLLQNAFKFTGKEGVVSLTTRVTNDRVAFDVEDACGGLPPGAATDLFRPFEQRGADRSGVGLGLSICRKAAEANGGELRIRDLPGKGCVFTLDLPRLAASRTPAKPKQGKLYDVLGAK